MTAGLGGAPVITGENAPFAATRPPPEPLRAGEIVVLQLPNAKRDVNSGAPRPRLIVQGSARVVAFAHGGNVLCDGPGSANGLVLPLGTERIAVLATGDGAVQANGLTGWHSGQELPFVGWSCALAAGAVVYAEGGTVSTTPQRFRAGWAHAAELVTGTTIVNTRFTNPIQTVAVLLDDPVDSDAARGLSLTLDGADRAKGPNGVALPPTVVVVSNRSVLIYAIVPALNAAGAPAGGPITVSVMSQDGWHLAGVVGASESPQSLSTRAASNGLDSLVQPLVSSRTGSALIMWAAAPPPAPTPTPSPTPTPTPTRAPTPGPNLPPKTGGTT